MSKILVCGDLHTKYNIFEKVKDLAEGYDKTIFLGDYVDEWNKAPDASYNLLFDLIAHKKQKPEKTVLLLGNHCLSEWLGVPFACSGYNPYTHDLVSALMKQEDNWRLFQIAHAENGVLFTHAGITESWARNFLDSEDNTAEKIADKLNWALQNRTADGEKIFLGLANAGYARGGNGDPSPIWADEIELMADCYPNIEQVVGHTPVRTIEIINQFGKRLTFCDTHSLYPDGRQIGDNTLLEINDGQKNIISLD